MDISTSNSFSTSSALGDYYAQERATLATKDTLRADLQALGITHVQADYDGVGDSGQIEALNFWKSSSDESPHQGPSIEVSPSTEEKVRRSHSQRQSEHRQTVQ